jgi:hypothetical protein
VGGRRRSRKAEEKRRARLESSIKKYDRNVLKMGDHVSGSYDWLCQ